MKTTRSEITLPVLQRGRALDAVPASVFGPVVAVVIVTMVGVPLVLRMMLHSEG